MADSTRGKGRPSLSEVAEIDREIRDAAVKVLAELGAAATMQAVAQRAGLSRKSLYARYPSKDELFVQAIRAMLTEVAPLAYSREGDDEERLRSFIETALMLFIKPEAEAFQRLLTTEPLYNARLRADMMQAARRIFHEPLVELLEPARNNGAFAIDDTDSAARLIVRLIFTERMSAEIAQSAGTPAPVAAQSAAFIANLLINGLKPRPA